MSRVVAAARAPARGLALAAAALAAGALAARAAGAWEPPVEAPRIQQSALTAVYAPSSGLVQGASFPLHDNFSVEGSWVNLFPRGRNLNFWFGLEHSIKDAPVYPAAALETESFDAAPQARDMVYFKSSFVFYDYFQLNGRLEYLQNRNVASPAGRSDYDFDRLGLSGELAWDLRWSSIEKYYKGKVFLFPEEGFRIAAGLREYAYFAAAGGPPSWSPQAYGEAQVLLHPSRFWVLSLGAMGETNLVPGAPRYQAATPKVLGAFDAAGDYAADAVLELRFLHATGLFWESPEFWYISSFLFKFSPGFVLGYDAGLAGRYGDPRPVLLHSGYAGLLVAVRMNGDLVTVLRADFAASSSGLYKVVLSASFGTVATGKSSPVLKSGIR